MSSIEPSRPISKPPPTVADEIDTVDSVAPVVVDAEPVETETVDETPVYAELVDPDPIVGEVPPGQLRLRVAALLVMLVTLTPLGVARTLTPATQGLGTHQQLGLPPCSMRVLFSIRCPACGMTTSWSHWTRGQWISSFQSNTGGTLLAFLVPVIAFLAGRVLWTGRLPSTTTSYRIGWAIVAIGAITLSDWFIRLTL
ncbi:DUF2752 domain-containing protein [Aporhodopirellula aestuarii]|uniref:DUF2752 domain-containing protein n=1 Tax=Aporhodopirellula aestuarii TaxID=2950107 RepID=A0ABT0UCD4_9BACT|nr:DUF2752 domain-containing protein [Aporhodopirellula aestuarii]MCM2374140.1 DUF2752 domain-containing protein [Aporhodopirellula aestuarii]